MNFNKFVFKIRRKSRTIFVKAESSEKFQNKYGLPRSRQIFFKKQFFSNYTLGEGHGSRNGTGYDTRIGYGADPLEGIKYRDMAGDGAGHEDGALHEDVTGKRRQRWMILFIHNFIKCPVSIHAQSHVPSKKYLNFKFFPFQVKVIVVVSITE